MTASSSASMHAMRQESISVLHVDDDRDFAALTADLLERQGEALTVRTENSAEAGLEALAESDVDCVVSDYDMPGMSGLEFLEAVREDHPNLPFILFTGKGSEEVASDAFAAGATDYLPKKRGTDQYEVLANRVRNTVENARSSARQRRHLEAIESAREGIALLNDEGQFTYVNRAYADVFGYEPEELVGRHWESICTEEGAEFARGEVLPTVEARGYWRGRSTGVRSDGSTFPEDHVVAATVEGGLVCTVRDVSEEETREALLSRYETILEALNDPVYAVDPEGRFSYVNDAFCDLVGYDREEILGAEPSLIKDEESVVAAEENLQRLCSADGPDSVTFEIEIQPKEGDPIPCEDHMGAIFGDDGNLEASVGAIRDVSERVERAEELERYESIIEASGDPVYTIDAEGRFTYVNDAMVEKLGYDREEMLGEHVSLVMPPEDIDRGAAVIAEMIEGDRDRDRNTFEMTAVTAEGERLVCENHIGLLAGEDGIEGTVGTVRDISGRIERERALEDLHGATRELMAATDAEGVAAVGCRTASEVLDLAVNGVHYYDSGEEALVPVAWSEGVKETLGEEPPAIPAGEGLAWEAYEAGEPRIYPDIRDTGDVLSEETPFRSELHLPLGEYGVLLAGSTDPDAFDSADETLAQVLAANLETALDRVEREQELERQNERLEEFASIVSHDLRNPLNVAEGRLELARLAADGEALDHLGAVESAHDRMEGLVEDLLALARHGNAVESPEWVRLPALVRKCWGTVDTGDAELCVETDRTVEAEPGRLKQLLENLIRNAVEHGATNPDSRARRDAVEHGSTSPDSRARQDAAKHGSTDSRTQSDAVEHGGEGVRVEVGDTADGFYVADDGPGVPDEERDRIFEAGYSTAAEGTGFGLRIVRRVAEAHGWEVTVRESETGGARFEITGVAGD